MASRKCSIHQTVGKRARERESAISVQNDGYLDGLICFAKEAEPTAEMYPQMERKFQAGEE